MEELKEVLTLINIFFVLYLIGYSTFLFLSILIGSIDLYRQNKTSKLKYKIENENEIPISIIIPAYNEEITVIDTINSLLLLEYKNYEIIIVDDGSTDNTAKKIIEKFNMNSVNKPLNYKLKCKKKETNHSIR